MKRRISIFAFLFCAFAAVGQDVSYYYAAANVPCTITHSNVGTKSFKTKAADYYYYQNSYSGVSFAEFTFNNGNTLTADSVANCRFLGWYSKSAGWSVLSEVTAESANDLITEDERLTDTSVGKAGKAGNAKVPVVFAKYVKVWTVTAGVDPAGAGTVSLSGTNALGKVDDGGSVTLTATANAGYEFSKWSDGPTDNPRTIGSVLSDATYTAKFMARGYSVSTQPENAVITVSKTGTYDENLEIGWEPEGEAGYDYTFVSAQVLDGNTELAEYTTGMSANFNMKDVCGQYHSGVKVAVKYARTPREYPWTIDVSNTGIASVRYRIGSGDYQETATNLTVAVPYGTQLEAYAKGEKSYTPDYTVDKKWARTMPVDELTFKPTAKLNGYKLTIHHKGAYYDGKLLEETALEPLVVGTTNLNEILVAVPTNGAAFYGYYSTEGGSTQIYDEHGKCCKVDGIWSGAWAVGGTFEGNANLEVWAKWGPPPEYHSIRAVCDPADGGTVEPASTNVVKNKDVTLIATANPGYSFSCWTNGTGIVSTDNPWTFTAIADATYTAVFTGNVVRVNFDIGDYDGATPRAIYVTFGKPYGHLPDVDYDDPNLTFTRWLDAEGKNEITENTIVSIPVGHALRADNPSVRTKFDVVWVDPTGKNQSITNSSVARDTPISTAPEATADWHRNWDGEYWISGWTPALPQTVTGDLTFSAVRMSIADVLDCTNLTFTVGTSNWRPVGDQTAKGNDCMRLDASSGDDVLATSVATSGTLTFRWKGGKQNVTLWLRKAGTEFQEFHLTSVDQWKDESVFIENEPSEKVELGFHLQERDLSLSYCAIDSVTWTSGGEPPAEPCTVTFHDPSGTFSDFERKVEFGTGAVAPADWISDKFDPKSCGWDKDFSQVMEDITVNAVWTCRVEFIDGGGGNPPVTNKVDYGQPVVAPTVFTPPADKHFGGWDPSIPATIESNSVFTVVWTDNPTYTVTYSWNEEMQTDTKKQGVPLTLKGAIFTRAGYEQDGWSKNPDGFVKDFDLGPDGTYSDDADLTLYPTWKELKPVVIDEIARALDCENAGLTFTATGGWSVFTNEQFAKEGVSCLSNKTKNATLTTTLSQSGKLTFWWKANGGSGGMEMSVKANDKEVADLVVDTRQQQDWTSETISIDASAGNVELVFWSVSSGTYTAIDHVTWTPEGGGEPTPGEQVKIAAAGVANGVFSLTIPAESGTDYGVWTNADLTIDSWGLMGEPQTGKGMPMEFKWTILPGFPQLFFRAHEVEYK